MDKKTAQISGLRTTDCHALIVTMNFGYVPLSKLFRILPVRLSGAQAEAVALSFLWYFLSSRARSPSGDSLE